MAESRFVYVTYIRTTPEKLWQALTEPEFTRRYWVETWQDCEWKQGASWRIMIPDGRIADSGEVLEIEPATFRKRLSRARTRLYRFMKERCGVFDPRNECRCQGQVACAVERLGFMGKLPMAVKGSPLGRAPRG